MRTAKRSKPKRRERRVVGTNIIAILRNEPLTTADAVSELIDNAFDEMATAVLIEFYRDRVVFTDNGPGLRDLNLLVDLESVSRNFAERIGNYGIGAKLAQLHFGDEVLFESVCEGVFRRQRFNWREIEKANDWGYKFDVDETLAMRRAPRALVNGGLRITVSELRNRHHLRYIDEVCHRLTYRYRLGLMKGKTIKVIDHTAKDVQERRLTPNLSALGVYDNMKTLHGEVNGLKFEISYTDLKETSKLLNGVHFGFGYRFVTKTAVLNKQNVPSKLYAEVHLLPEPGGWKDCLDKTKTVIVRGYEELCEAVYAVLKDWIDFLEKYDDEFEIEEFSAIFADQFANVLIFKPRKDRHGDYRPGPRTATSMRNDDKPGPPDPDPDPDPGPGPGPIQDNREAIYDPENGIGDAEKRKRRLGGFKVDLSTQMGEHSFAEYEFSEANRKLVVRINRKKALIADAVRKPYKVNVFWGVCAAQIARFARDLAGMKQLEEKAAWLIDILKSAGFTPSEDPDILFDQVNCYVVDKFAVEAKRRKLDVAV